MGQNYRDPTIDAEFPYQAEGISYLITLRLAEGNPVLTDNPEVAEFLLETIPESAEMDSYLALAAVVMPDHLHLIVQNQRGETELSDFLRKFKSYTTNQLWNYGYEGEVWQRKYHERRIRGRSDFKEKFNYVRMNPVEEGLVEAPSEWQWLRVWRERSL